MKIDYNLQANYYKASIPWYISSQLIGIFSPCPATMMHGVVEVLRATSPGPDLRSQHGNLEKLPCPGKSFRQPRFKVGHFQKEHQVPLGPKPHTSLRQTAFLLQPAF